MNRKIFAFMAALIVTLTIFSVTSAKGQRRLDGEPDKMPRKVPFCDEKYFRRT